MDGEQEENMNHKGRRYFTKPNNTKFVGVSKQDREAIIVTFCQSIWELINNKDTLQCNGKSLSL